MLSVTCHPSPRGTKWENRKGEGSVLLERHLPSHGEGLGEASGQESRVPSAGRALQTMSTPSAGTSGSPRAILSDVFERRVSFQPQLLPEKAIFPDDLACWKSSPPPRE